MTDTTVMAIPRQVTVAGQELTLYVESEPLLLAMLADIQAAQRRVWLETYIFLDDTTGQAVAAALKEKARAGLDVRVMCDGVGSATTRTSFFRELEAAGCKVHVYHSFWEALTRWSPLRILNVRNHRKLLVIDDDIAYFGGMNVMDTKERESARPRRLSASSTGWRDVHVRLVGSRQTEVAESFDRSWRRAHGEKISRRPAAYRRAELAHAEESIQFFDSGPGKRYTRAARVFSRLIRLAQRRLVMAMAYFLPVGRVARDLLAAHRRGVFIQVVLPGKSDVPLIQRATMHLYGRLLRRRFHIFERQANMLHSKVMLVDDTWAIVGSANLDARSLWINLEFFAVFHSREMVRVLLEIVRDELKQSRRVTLRECLQRSWWERLLNRAAWSLRWWL